MAPSLHLFALLALPALVFLVSEVQVDMFLHLMLHNQGVGGLVPLSKPSSRDVLHGTWTSKGCYTLAASSLFYSSLTTWQ